MMDIDQLLQKMTLEEKASLYSGSDFWHTQPVERLGIPAVMMCDGPNGLRKQKGEGDHLGINESIETVCYPTASAVAASFDTELLEKLGQSLGEECQAEQVGMLLGPGVNMKRSPLCGRNFEYFSEDPYLAGELAASYISGLQGQGVAACVKHFAANNQETCRMSGSSKVDERALHEIYLPAFEAAVKKGGTRSIMCAYNAVNDVFCAENKKLLTDILREEWGFGGFVVTDWGAAKDEVRGIKSGLNLIMPGGTEETAEAVVNAVRDGILAESDLDHAVGKVLEFVRDYLDNQKPDVEFDREKARAFSASLAKESAVLLKNENILPLSKEKKTAFIGEFARSPRYQGAGSSHINVKHAVSAMECVEGLPVVYAQGYRAKEDKVDEQLLREAVEAASQAEAAVIFAGLPNAFETEGCDREHMSMPENQNALIEAIAAVQKNTVVILHGGAPVEMPWIDKVSSVLCLYLGGDQAGKAAVELMYGDANPCGKLAETWPERLEDNPSYLTFPGCRGNVEYREGIFIGYRYYDKRKMKVQFPFGHGLSYTSFSYSDLKLDRVKMTEDERVTVSCKVKNTGSRAGKEVVQLYVGAIGSEAIRPVRELKGFIKVSLEPGEEKEVHFVLDKRAFAYYEELVHDWFVESGKFAIEIGASSRDIRLRDEMEIQGLVELPIYYTENSTLADLAKTSRGRQFMEQMAKKREAAGNDAGQQEKRDDLSNLGEGSERMVQAMMREMPLSSMVSFGGMSKKELKEIVAMLNQNETEEG